MAQTTVELRKLLTTNNFKLFDFDYRIDDPKFKKEVEEAIIDFYYFYEIGQETPDKFKHHFRTRFKRIIGYYNDLYNTTLLKYNPLTNYKMEEALEQLSTRNNTQDSVTLTKTDNTNTFDNLTDIVEDKENSVTGKTTADNNSTHENTTNTDNNNVSNTKNSDYPQQSIGAGNYLNGEQLTEDQTNGTVVNHGKTLGTNETTSEQADIGQTHTKTTNIGKNIGSDKTDSTGKIKGDETANTNYQKTIEGITRTTYQELIQLERENILRLKGQIVEEMKPCFMLTY